LLKVVFFQEKGTKVDVTWNLQLQAENSFEIVQHETFAPVLYLLKYSGTVENALELQNGGSRIIICDYD
jgi:acyl-CoA reductase-like NAD-dependent aldehyde dehydrogenase